MVDKDAPMLLPLPVLRDAIKGLRANLGHWHETADSSPVAAAVFSALNNEAEITPTRLRVLDFKEVEGSGGELMTCGNVRVRFDSLGAFVAFDCLADGDWWDYCRPQPQYMGDVTRLMERMSRE